MKVKYFCKKWHYGYISGLGVWKCPDWKFGKRLSSYTECPYVIVTLNNPIHVRNRIIKHEYFYGKRFEELVFLNQ